MKKLMFVLAACLMMGTLGAAELQWTTDLPKAQAAAKAQGKMVFLNFTGSDWCVWCKKLDADVFSKPEFIDFANKHMIMVCVDFPSKKEISATQKAANKALKEKYAVKGFPALIVLNGKVEQVYSQEGYMGDVKKWLADLEAARKK